MCVCVCVCVCVKRDIMSEKECKIEKREENADGALFDPFPPVEICFTVLCYYLFRFWARKLFSLKLLHQ